MPALIEHIDRIARCKGRDVLFVTFHDDPRDRINWRHLPVRQQIIDWLDGHAIDWCCCGPFADDSGVGRYQGQLYIDVPFDTADPVYQTLSGFLEQPDGTSALAGTRFCYLPLAYARKNVAHDAPGYWDGQV